MLGEFCQKLRNLLTEALSILDKIEESEMLKTDMKGALEMLEDWNKIISKDEDSKTSE